MNLQIVLHFKSPRGHMYSPLTSFCRSKLGRPPSVQQNCPHTCNGYRYKLDVCTDIVVHSAATDHRIRVLTVESYDGIDVVILSVTTIVYDERIPVASCELLFPCSAYY
jgi:hypothetical protein